MEKLTKKLTKLRDDFNLHVYLKRNPEAVQGMTVKEVNSLIDSLGSKASLYEGTVSREHDSVKVGNPHSVKVGKPRRSYQAVLASVKSNIAAGRAVDDRVENTNADSGREM